MSKKQENMFKYVSLVLGLLVIILIFLILILSIQNNNVNSDSNDIKDNNLSSNIVIIETSMGNIKIKLDPTAAPITVANFKSYVNDGFYDGLIFHRIIGNFMIQGGGFTSSMIQKQTKAPIKLESNNGLKNTVGTIAMARTNVPDSATSQFFINVVDNSFLDYSSSNPGYAVFGKVIEGMDVVNKIKSVKTTTKNGMQNVPVNNVVINKVYMQN